MKFLAAERAEVRLDMDVIVTQESELLLGLVVDEYREPLPGNGQSGTQLFLRLQGKAKVYGDNDVGTHVAHDLDRQVAGYAAVGQQSSIDPFRLEYPRHCHAGMHRDDQVAGVEHHHFSATDISGYGTKRDWKRVEIFHGRDREGQPAKRQVEILALHQSAREQHPAAVDAEVEVHQEAEIVGLAAERPLRAGRTISQKHVPVGGPHDLFEFVGAQSRSIEPAHHGAHARPCDVIHGHVQVFQHPNDTDMRTAARAASAEHQADGRACADFMSCEYGQDGEKEQGTFMPLPATAVARQFADHGGTTVVSAGRLLNIVSRCIQTSATASATLR